MAMEVGEVPADLLARLGDPTSTDDTSRWRILENSRQRSTDRPAAGPRWDERSG